VEGEKGREGLASRGAGRKQQQHASVGGCGCSSAELAAAGCWKSGGGEKMEKTKERKTLHFLQDRTAVIARGSKFEHQDLDVVVLKPSERRALQIAEELDVAPMMKTTRRRNKKSKATAAETASSAAMATGLSKSARRKLKKLSAWIKV
jgi:hypothetical protein